MVPNALNAHGYTTAQTMLTRARLLGILRQYEDYCSHSEAREELLGLFAELWDEGAIDYAKHLGLDFDHTLQNPYREDY